MRLSDHQATLIRTAVARHFGPGARVILFGSRVDDHQRGGDIDLLIQTDQNDVAAITRAEIALLAQLNQQLGEQRIDILLDYPTRTLRPPIFSIAERAVEILNPYNEKETSQEKLSIVDVKARDQEGRIFQIEIQITIYPSLPDRIAYTWASVYSKQLKRGKNYAALKPVYSIWIVDGHVNDQKGYRHRYRLRDDSGKELTQAGGIWLFELPKF